MRVLKQEAVGVVVDVQEKLYPHIDNNEELKKNLEILIKGLKSLDIPLLVTQQYTKALGETIEGVSKAIGEYSAIEKRPFSCYDEEEFKNKLDSMDRKYVILCGIESHICVMQTAIDLKEKGYIPVIVEDCVSSRRKNDKRVALDRLRNEGAIVTTYESLLFELCRTSKADNFKTISKLVK